MKVLLIDCYDSFTYNLSQQVGYLGAEPRVVTSDTPLEDVIGIPCDRIILSPGPGKPEDSGVGLRVLGTLSRTIPTLGVCLGHQAICVAFGGRVVRAPRPVHGKVSPIHHDGKTIFSGLGNPLSATRYHSLVADPASLPPDLEVSAVSGDDGSIMGLRHRVYPVEGIQFHPESILTPDGDTILRRFLFPQGGSS
ncbi:MAG: aminodeoxychorismate/anthranilate synthase component II [Methanomicrobiales archaeon]|nr:aminodeoxychorismate/anthranilate synthase component II [Methanomicrobiales archaeon]MDD1655018.1 aminodeoxychorismate/anthranilate synthase component II [Methanomicrobiales archaeon]